MPKQHYKTPPPPPGEVWDEAFWRAYRSAKALAPFSRIYECLGLKFVNKNVLHPFNPGAVVQLSVDIYALASRVCSVFPGPEVVQAAVSGCEFDKDIDALLEKYGERIWGGKREERGHLISPGAGELYTEDINWPQDKARIRVFVHQWVFMRAVKKQHYIVCKQTRDGKKAALRGGATDTEPALSKSKKVSGRHSQDQNTRPTTLTANQTSRTPATTAHPPTSAPSHSTSNPDSLSARQAKLADTLTKYIYEPQTHPNLHDKFAALKDIYLEWANHAVYYRTTMHADYNTFDAVLTAWLDIQRTLLAWSHPAHDTQPDKRTVLEKKLSEMYTEWTSVTYYFDEEPMASGEVAVRLFKRMMGGEAAGLWEEDLGVLDRRVEIVIWSSWDWDG
ncbi:hypothetical protein FB567DRAFT_591560 [Paraphoma chrysanthemicola]|uniref:Uncharacterized protein n=1 Tax=Paraphoma chrysanthemicola TaxID=798071 RepID=A0A8K0R9F6_9PLEO|nr:hypothetical protein FB567DRAFT_591560 [Paraphoma chrysanthemicola]